MVLAEKHLREVLIAQAVDVALLSRYKTLETVCTRRESVDGAVELGLRRDRGVTAVYCNLEDLTIATADNDSIRGYRLDCSYTHCA